MNLDDTIAYIQKPKEKCSIVIVNGIITLFTVAGKVNSNCFLFTIVAQHIHIQF